jgi:vitamin B12 transporter
MKFKLLLVGLTIGLLFVYAPIVAQQLIKGTVTAEADAKPVAGASVTIKGTTFATSTNSSGQFSLSVPQLPVTLVVSYVGFKPEAMPVRSSVAGLRITLHYIAQSLEGVVVTAGRSKQRLKDVPQKVELISAKDIANTPALDVTDIIKKTTAVDVIQYPGILSGVGFRGFRPQFSGLNQHTLLLINGRPAGTTNLGTLDLNYVDHIEVLKGPASALYGSQAMGGVVNIITPQSNGDVKGSLYADYGTYNTTQFGGRTGGNLTQKLDFDLSATYFQRNTNFKMGSDGIFRSLLGSTSATEYYTNGTVSATDDVRGDGQTRPNTRYKYYNTSARIGYKIDSNWRVDVSGTLFRANHVESPGDIFSGEGGAGLKNILRNNGEAALTGKLKNNELGLRAYYANESSTTFAVRTAAGAVIPDPYLSGISKYKWYGVQLKDAITFWQHQKVIIGYDHNEASSNTISDSAPNATTGVQTVTATAPDAALITNGLYVQGQFNLVNDKLKINPGLRYDVTSFKLLPTDNYTKTLGVGANDNKILSPSLSVQFNFIGDFAVHGSVGSAFVTPDALQIAGYQATGTGSGKVTISQGNPDLKNESSVSEEVGIKYDNTRSGFIFDATYFTTNVKDRIATISAPPSPSYSIGTDVVTAVTNYYNANKSRIRGLEFNLSYDFGALADFRYTLRTFANMTNSIQAQDITVAANGDETAAAIQNVAKTNINYGLEYGNNRNYTVRLTGRYVGRRWDTDFNDPLRPLVYYPDFIVLDLAGSYNLTRHHQISLAVNNLTDENYYEKRGYSQPGRTLRLRYTYNFGNLFKH